jgi:two-component system, NtrC family, sensor histidine kinase PilS
MLFRVVMITLVLGITVALNAAEPQQLAAPAQVLLFAIIGVTYALTIVYALLVRRVSHYGRFADFQIAGDLIITTVLVHATGGAQSGYTFFYPLAIVGAATVRYGRGALITALASAVLLVGVSLGGWLRLLPSPPGLAPWDTPGLQVLRRLTLDLGACAAIGVLATLLGRQLEQSGARLELSREFAADLAALYEHVVRCLSSGLLTTDKAGQLMTVNEAAAEILGVDPLAVVGKPALDVLPGLAAVLAGLEERDVVRRGEIRAWRPDGTALALGVSISPLLDGRGAPLGRIVNFQDLTELRRMEQQMRRGERLAVVGGIAAGLAHEIRNPLASISGSIELLRASPLNPDDRRLMDIVLREVDRLNALCTDLLDYARPRERLVLRVDVAALVDETLRVFAADRTLPGVTAKVTGAPAAAGVEVEADPAQLRQVLWNLLRNAAEAMPEGGEVGVSVTVDGGGVELSVSDSGQGIAPEDQERIFEPFYTTKERGSGLGLATVHRIVHEHGGQVSIQSAPGKGTRVTVRLPLAAPAPARAALY